MKPAAAVGDSIVDVDSAATADVKRAGRASKWLDSGLLFTPLYNV